jgi:hypothetical protein
MAHVGFVTGEWLTHAGLVTRAWTAYVGLVTRAWPTHVGFVTRAWPTHVSFVAALTAADASGFLLIRSSKACPADVPMRRIAALVTRT